MIREAMQSPGTMFGSVGSRHAPLISGWVWPPLATDLGWLLRGGSEEEERLEGPDSSVRTPKMSRLEAVLFLAQEPLASRKIAQLASLADGTEARTLVASLNRMYDTDRCAFRVVEVAGGFQLMTRPKFAPWLRRLHASQVEVRLSPPALETLAVVAYRQPVLRAEVEAIRGVQCGEILRQLMERDLVRIAGRSEELGRPLLYGTTRRFLQVFGLRRLDELPQPSLARGAGPVVENAQPAGGLVPGPESTLSSQTVPTHTTEEESTVKTRLKLPLASDALLPRPATAGLAEVCALAPRSAKDEDVEDEDEDLEDDEEEDDDLEEDVEEEEWEEVPEEDEEDEDWDDDEEEEWEDEEDDDWDDEDDDWEDDEDDDLEEEEKEGP